MKTVKINIYTFEELNKDAQEKAIQEHEEFLYMVDGEEFEREEIIENILVNNYYFFEDGKLAHTTHYTGNHPDAGKEEFHFHGRTVTI